MVTMDQAQQLLGARVVDADGDKVGTINEVYLDDVTGEPNWVTVTTGWFGLSESFVPLDRARISDDQIRVPFDKATIKDAPRYDGGEPLSSQDEDELYRHYAITADVPGAARDTNTDNTGHTEILDGGEVPDESLIRWEEQSSVPRGSNPQELVTRSEEQSPVGTERVRTGRARLRKYVVTEQQTVTVPVSHEELRLEPEPITETERDKGSTGAGKRMPMGQA
jgi:stress response protein YsnF